VGIVRVMRRFAMVAVLCLSSAAPALADEGRGSAAGGGVFLYQGTLPIKFGFAATLHPDGSASGTFHQSYELGGNSYAMWGQVTCMAIDLENGRAWVGGVLTKVVTTDAAFVPVAGDDAWFRVLDTGPGSAQADRSTVFGFKGIIPTSAEYCAMRPWAPDNARTHAVDVGNIVVR
jgi:hypothetical protein